MWRVTWTSLRDAKLRFAMTGLAVVLGTAFVSGALTLGDTLEEGFADLFETVAGSADVVVRAEGGESSVVAGPGDVREAGLVPAALVDELRDRDDVALAAGEMGGNAVLIGDDGTPVTEFGPPTMGFNAWDDESAPLEPGEIREGRLPAHGGEVVVDAGTVEAQGWELGDEVRVVFDGPVQTAELVGVYALGELDSLGGASVVLLDHDTAAERLGTDGDYLAIHVLGADGTDADELAAAIDGDLGTGYEALTAAETAEEEQAALAEFLVIFDVALLVFAGIALLVGVFLIFNTFTIVLAQRLRHLALLRAVGAGRRQLLGSVLGEAGAVGLLGGLLGGVLGFGLAALLHELLATVGFDFPSSGLAVSLRSVVVAAVVGVVVTLAAALVPALRAARVPPVAALQEVAVGGDGGRGIGRTVLGVTLLAAGAAAIAAGLVAGAGAQVVGIGAVAVFLGVAGLASFVARPLAAVIGWPASLRGFRGELARSNAMRNPRRTAATASALMIGLALVAFVAIFATSLTETSAEALDDVLQGDVVVQAAAAGGVSETVLAELDDVDEVAVAEPFGTTAVEIDGEERFVGVMGAEAFAVLMDVDVTDGDLSGFGEGGLLITEGAADRAELAAGDVVEVVLPDGAQEVPVAAVVADTGVDVSWFVERSTVEGAGGEASAFQAYVALAEGVDAADGLAAVEAALADYPQVEVLDQEGLLESIRAQVNQLLGVVVALLALSVLIALLGIVNTVALSVVERTREIGLLRAVGMTRRQLRGTVRSEAMIVALMGAVLGLVLGVGFGVLLVGAVDEITVLAVPWGWLVTGLALAALAGLTAGVLPARRAARQDVLAAVRTD